MSGMLEITDQMWISEEELTFTASRSGGPGGQNVNKVNSRVTLWFDVAGSGSLTEEQKQRIRTRLATRIDKQGVLRVVSQAHRSQVANREAATDRFVELLRESLRRRPARKPTKVSRAVKQRRLEEKGRRSRVKQQRSKPISRDD
jgi:ribosome-associated protein